MRKPLHLYLTDEQREELFRSFMSFDLFDFDGPCDERWHLWDQIRDAVGHAVHEYDRNEAA